MGCGCSSKKEDPTSKHISKAVAKNRQKESQVKRLLLLGAGGSGKSTFFKQLTQIHGKGLDERQRQKYKDPVYDNVISCIQFVLQKAEDQGVAFETKELDALAVEVLRQPSDLEVEGEIAQQISELWKTPEVQKLFEHYTEREGDGTIHASTAWFFDSLERISKPGYIPSVEDVIRVRFRTTGIVEQDFQVTQNRHTLSFRIFDVGGQKSERRKWIHCFENVTGVLFVSSLTGYNEKLWEASDENRMVDSLSLFKNICNSRWFKDSAMIVFLNKKDLFEKRIQDVPLTVCPAFENLPESHANDCKSAIAAIRKRFQDQRTRYKSELFIHETVAIDSENVKRIFDSVRMQILKDNLEACGLA